MNKKVCLLCECLCVCVQAMNVENTCKKREQRANSVSDIAGDGGND